MTGVEADRTLAERNSPSLDERVRELEAGVALLKRAHGQPAGLTIVAFSGDMDRLMAAFMLACGAAAMGMKVSMFFTFWALAALRRKAVYKGKSPIEKLLTAMMPAGPEHLGLSRWSVLGLGKRFFHYLLRRKHIESLKNLVALAQELNIRMVACEMSMEVLAIGRDELIDGVEFGGVATCIDSTLDGTLTFFV